MLTILEKRLMNERFIQVKDMALKSVMRIWSRKLLTTYKQCGGAGTFFHRISAPAPSTKGWLPAPKSHFNKFLIQAPALNPSKKDQLPDSRLLGAVFRTPQHCVQVQKVDIT